METKTETDTEALEGDERPEWWWGFLKGLKACAKSLGTNEPLCQIYEDASSTDGYHLKVVLLEVNGFNEFHIMQALKLFDQSLGETTMELNQGELWMHGSIDKYYVTVTVQMDLEADLCSIVNDDDAPITLEEIDSAPVVNTVADLTSN